MTVSVDTSDHEVLHRNRFVAHVTRHALTRENTTRILRHTDRTRDVVRTRVTVRCATRSEVVTLDGTGVALTDRHALHVDFLAYFEDVRTITVPFDNSAALAESIWNSLRTS